MADIESRNMALLAFGDPGFFDFIAKGFKSVAPVLSFGAGFIPGIGPLVSKGIDALAGQVADQSDQGTDDHYDDDGEDDE